MTFGHQDRHAYRKHHVKMKAEIAVIHLQAKRCQRMPANPQKLGKGQVGKGMAGKGHGTGLSFHSLQKEPTLLTLFWVSSLQKREKINLVS